MEKRTTGKPAAQILLERYWDEASNQGNVELVRELCADPITRHDPEKTTELTHDEQIARLQFGIDKMGVQISRVLVHANEEYATSVWNVSSTTDENLKLCGIEVFRVENGRLVECWNTPYAQGHWG
jgi:hypothetical protein